MLVTTHNMEEAEQCDRLAVLVDGSIAAEGSVSAVVGGARVAEVRSADWRKAFGLLDDAGFVCQLGGAAIRVAASAAAVSAVLAHHGFDVGVTEEPTTLEEAFVGLISGRAPT